MKIGKSITPEMPGLRPAARGYRADMTDQLNAIVHTFGHDPPARGERPLGEQGPAELHERMNQAAVDGYLSWDDGDVGDLVAELVTCQCVTAELARRLLDRYDLRVQLDRRTMHQIEHGIGRGGGNYRNAESSATSVCRSRL